VERDDIGRLTRLVFESKPPIASGQGNAWLIAVDGSAHALRAVAEFLKLAEQLKSCRIHIANIQHWLSKEAAETELIERGWPATEAAITLIENKGLPWQLHLTMGAPAESIVALASQLACSKIVIGNRGLGATESLLTGSITRKVIELAPIPVLVVP
jgi:nucleotide-binding universal stress UspA family protein